MLLIDEMTKSEINIQFQQIKNLKTNHRPRSVHLRGFNGLVLFPENCDFRLQFEIVSYVFFSHFSSF